MKLGELRKKYPVFTYEKYDWELKGDNFHVSFSFTVGDIKFNPKVIIREVDLKRYNKLEDSVLDNLVFNLGMIEMLSYWKATCSKKILVKAGKLDKSQIKWFEDILLNGMGQFFYENKINFTKEGFIEIVSEGTEKLSKGEITGEGVLIPIGGGKDSALALDLLKEFKKDVDCFILNPNKNTMEMFEVSGYKNLVIAERKIEEKLLEMNRKGFLNGHTPFVAYLSFLTVLVSYLFNKKYIVLSNEDSSSEGNVTYLGKEINHQYSKSYDFEKKFREYSTKYLVEKLDYFSVLRPFYDIQIAKIFSSLKKYFPVFLSCNESQKTYSGTRKKTGKWCGNCSKCLFVFMILYPFMKEEDMISIFKENLYQKKGLLEIMKELIGEKEVKPFECVGTRKESLVALYLSLEKAKEIGKTPYLLDYFEKKVMPKHKDWEKMTKEVMSHWNDKNNIPWTR